MNIKKSSRIVVSSFWVLLASCGHSDTLDSLTPPVVTFSRENPNWKNGIGELVRERCASCHAKSRQHYAPPQAPLIDFTQESEFLLLKKRSLARIQGEGAVMPPAYADPLTEDEKNVLVLYLQGKIE